MYNIILHIMRSTPNKVKPLFCVNVENPRPIKTNKNPINNNKGKNVFGFDKFNLLRNRKMF